MRKKLTTYTLVSLIALTTTGCVKEEDLNKAIAASQLKMKQEIQKVQKEHNDALSKTNQEISKNKQSQIDSDSKLKAELDNANKKLADIKTQVTKLNNDMNNVKNSAQIMDKFKSGLKDLLNSL